MSESENPIINSRGKTVGWELDSGALVVESGFKEVFEPIELLNQFTYEELEAAILAGGKSAAQVQILSMNRLGHMIDITDLNFIRSMESLETGAILTNARKDELKKGIPKNRGR